MKTVFVSLLIFFSSTSFSMQKLDKTKSSTQNNKNYSISLKGWPTDFTSQIVRTIPEITRKDLDLEELNNILKKLDVNYNFNKLKLIKPNSGYELLLIGEISPQVKTISFKGLSDISESDALNLMGLNVSNILDEDMLKAGTEKLSQFYRDQGYRFAQVSFEIISETSVEKSVVFNIFKKSQTKLTEIKIEGLEQNALLKAIQKNIQRKFRLPTLNQNTLTKISTTLRKELSFSGYYQVQVPPPQILFSADELSARLIFKLKPAQRYRIEVINTLAFEHTNLEDDVLKLDSYYAKDQNMTSDLIEKLKTFYIAEGYPHINITAFETKKDNLIKLFLNVDEGPFTKIVDFRIIGQYSQDENFYKKKFFELGSKKIRDKVFIKEDMDLAVKNLLIYLQNEGYVNAKFSRVFISTEREKPGNGVLVIQIEEGSKVEVSDVKFNGVSEDNLKAVTQAANISANQTLSLNELEEAIANIKNYYHEAGYIEFKLLNINTDLVTYTDNNTKLDLKFDIQEGPKVEVQSIVVEGNTRTQDKIIRIELDFKPGEILNPSRIEESISRLQRTGHFNSVEILTLEKDSNIAKRTVVVKVTERDPGLRVLGIGLTDENKGTLHGYAGVAYRNFEGRGIGASFRSELNYNFAEVKYLEQKHTFGFVYPYLFDTRARFRASATRSNTIADSRINKVSEANTAIFSLEQDFTSHITGIFSYTVSTYKDHGIDPQDEIKYGYSSESLVIGSVGPTLDIDYRDNLFNPTRGSFSRFSLEYAAEPLGNNNADDFYRITGQTTHYFPFKDRFVFAQSLRGGYIKDIDDRGEGIPFDKKGFSLGGRTTIRGFESSEFFPTTAEIGASYRLQTSSSYELIKSEFRFPISEEYDLSGAIFYDGGRVHIEGVQLTNDWRDAAGIGIRYNTPVGPLNLEYGHKLDKKTGESDGAFHLSFGSF